MTDNEIIKALKCCINSDCECCPHYRDISRNCEEMLTKEVFDLFNRQNAEIEALKNSKSEAIKKFAERVVIAFYYEFEECIPSSLAEQIDEIVKEMTEDEK